MASYGDKLKGIPPEKAVDAVAYALAKCQATTFRQTRGSGKYHTEFVPAFMARLGIEDVVKVPARSTLEEVYQSHLAKKEVARIQAESETYKSKKAESDEEESHGSDDEDEESDDYVGLDDDDDDDDGPSASTLVPLPSAGGRRDDPKSKDELRAEALAAVPASLKEALSALQNASGYRAPTQRALRVLGFSGETLLQRGTSSLDDKACAMKWAKVALTDVVFNPQKIADARTVWRSLLGYHQGLRDDELEKQIAATRERCAEASLERLSARPHIRGAAVKARAANSAVTRKRVAKDQRADNAADADLRQAEIFDGRGAKVGTFSPFRRVLTPEVPTQLPSYVVPPDEAGPVMATEKASKRRVIVKCGELEVKIALGANGFYDIGIGLHQSQVPIATIHRNAVGVAAVATGGAWCGLRVDGCDQLLSHRGRNNSGTILIDVYKPAKVWAVGGTYDWTEAMPHMGMAVGSTESVQTKAFGELNGFQKVCFVNVEEGGIPGGLEALERDRAAVASKMRDAVKAHGDAAGTVRLAPAVSIEKLNYSRAPEDANYRLYVCGPSRSAGEVRPATRATLDWLLREGHKALHFVAERAARLGNVKVRLLAYAHLGSGDFHFDGAGDGPYMSGMDATSIGMAAPANFDSLNFSLSSGPVPAQMGPLGQP